VTGYEDMGSIPGRGEKAPIADRGKQEHENGRRWLNG